jgi:hypothetical protein
MPSRQSPLAAYKASAGLGRLLAPQRKDSVPAELADLALAAGFIPAALRIHSDHNAEFRPVRVHRKRVRPAS